MREGTERPVCGRATLCRADFLTRSICESVERTLLTLTRREALMELVGDVLELVLYECLAQLAPLDTPLRMLYTALGGRAKFLEAKRAWYEEHAVPFLKGSFAEMLAVDNAWCLTRMARHLSRLLSHHLERIFGSGKAAAARTAPALPSVPSARLGSGRPAGSSHGGGRGATLGPRRASWAESRSSELLVHAIEQGSVTKLQSAYRGRLSRRSVQVGQGKGASSHAGARDSPSLAGRLWA